MEIIMSNNLMITKKSLLIISVVSITIITVIALAIRPFLAERHYRDGYNFDAAKQTMIAITEFEKAVKYAPWETQYMMELARAYSDQANKTQLPEKLDWLNKAEAIAHKMISLDKKNPWYKNRLASIYLLKAEADSVNAQEYLQKAEYNVLQAHKDDDQNPIFLLNLAYFYHRMGRYDEAENAYKKTIEYDEAVVEAHFNFADLQKRKGNVAGALQSYILVEKFDPKFNAINAAIWQTAIALYNHTTSQEYLQIAAKYLQKDVDKNPTNLEDLVNLSTIYITLKEWAKAYQTYQIMFSYYPTQYTQIPNYVQSVINSGKTEEVRELATLRLQLNPNDPFSQKVLSALPKR